jgi:hypothetical protein
LLIDIREKSSFINICKVKEVCFPSELPDGKIENFRKYLFDISTKDGQCGPDPVGTKIFFTETATKICS